MNGFADELERQERRAETYRQRALCLHRKLRRDTAHEKTWDDTLEMFYGIMHGIMDDVGIPREFTRESGGKEYKGYHSLVGRMQMTADRLKEKQNG